MVLICPKNGFEKISYSLSIFFLIFRIVIFSHVFLYFLVVIEKREKM